MGLNGVFNAGPQAGGKTLLMNHVEDVDRRSFYAVADSERNLARQRERG
ncbi:MAG: hypothetical protein ACP5HG_18245 [Anaerolineae bacterium]